jgi:hypothetical protein
MRFCRPEKVSKVGGTLHLKEWYSLLVQFPGVSDNAAEAIIRHYSSFGSLMKAYESVELERDKRALLQVTDYKLFQHCSHPAELIEHYGSK